MGMGLAELKSELNSLIEQGDERLLRLLYSLAKEYSSDPAETHYPILSDQEFQQLVNEAEEQIQKGEVRDLNDFEKDTRSWD